MIYTTKNQAITFFRKLFNKIIFQNQIVSRILYIIGEQVYVFLHKFESSIDDDV